MQLNYSHGRVLDIALLGLEAEEVLNQRAERVCDLVDCHSSLLVVHLTPFLFLEDSSDLADLGDKAKRIFAHLSEYLASLTVSLALAVAIDRDKRLGKVAVLLVVEDEVDDVVAGGAGQRKIHSGDVVGQSRSELLQGLHLLGDPLTEALVVGLGNHDMSDTESSLEETLPHIACVEDDLVKDVPELFLS